MSQLLVRNLDPETVACLKSRAKQNHRSLQGEVKFILEEVANLSISNKIAPIWPQGFLERVVGGWQGKTLTRPTQDDYEQRDELE
jgi:hypothetical protein